MAATAASLGTAGQAEEDLLLLQQQRNKPRPYHPSLWGDFFLTHRPCTPAELLAMKEKARTKEEEVRRAMLAAAASADLAAKLELVDALQRIGVDYRFGKEIGGLLHAVHDDDGGCGDDLYLTSLRFYLLRKHGCNVTSDVFAKFRDEEGNFAAAGDDVKCLLMLFDAAHLRVHGEEVLDSAIAFTRCRLQSLMESLEPEMAEEVRYTLETPSFRRAQRVEARRFISMYEKKATRDESVLEFAKLDYIILRTMYCEELKALTMWWKNFQSVKQLGFARDRMPEIHFWMTGVCYEPYYSYSRIMLTKLVTLMSLFDDFYDNYSTTEESNVFTAALQRWDEEATEQLPACLREFYLNTLSSSNGIEEDLKLQNNKHAELVKELVIEVVKNYHAEVKWRDEHYAPTKVEEHLQLSVPTSGCMQITAFALISMGDVATSEAIEWVRTYPKIIRGVCIIGRVMNDIVSHEREQASDHVVSTVQTCMKEYGLTVAQANEKLGETVEEAWMDIVQECLDQKHPMAILEKAVNLARVMDFMYKTGDAYTLSHNLKDLMTSLYVKFV
ncbi:(E)-beta-farnesene synthase [Dichanthelium oligosanthes]|uniref:(E)-beta-farnesene synthase n=1 Tax=Dichanthelium oligosanthes TaxID=888268 RepID=A0A1E5W0J5_9POAL|nr:(E)-beta-farnesene synthase [Dichanthelium oligosanthes]